MIFSLASLDLFRSGDTRRAITIVRPRCDGFCINLRPAAGAPNRGILNA